MTTPARWATPPAAPRSRPRLSDEELEANARTYVDQAAKVLDMDKVELTRNSDWLGPLRMDEVLRLTSTVTVARMLERDDFSNRYAANEPISMLEFMYPLLQGYDSVAVRADVELGGTDQKFNLLMGRTIMEAYGQPPQSILTVPLLVGTDGEQKMSKSYGNYVGVSDAAGGHVRQAHVHPRRAHGHVHEPRHRTRQSARSRRSRAGLAGGSYHPAQAKRDLAERVVRLYHGAEAASAARVGFDRVFKEKDRPEDDPRDSVAGRGGARRTGVAAATAHRDRAGRLPTARPAG